MCNVNVSEHSLESDAKFVSIISLYHSYSCLCTKPYAPIFLLQIYQTVKFKKINFGTATIM